MKPLPRSGLALALLSIGLVATGCRSKLMAGPMPYRGEVPEAPVPTFDSPEATVVRHSDPVSVRRPGAVGSYPLTFYRKKERLGVGGVVECGGGGTAELYWPGTITSVVVANESVLVLGNPELDEPLFRFRAIEHARMVIGPGSRAGLPGGAEVLGDPADGTGPLILKRMQPRVVRLTNAAESKAWIHFREAVLEVGPSEAVDLPILDDSAPRPVDPATVTLEEGGIDLAVVGNVELQTGAGTPAGARLRAVEPASLKALGVRVDLPAGGEAVFSSLERRGPVREASEAGAATGSAEAPPEEAAAEPRTP